MERSTTEGELDESSATPVSTELSWWARRLGRRLFRSVHFDDGAVQYVRQLAERGSIVYVVRYQSFFEYFLVHIVLQRAGLPVPVFAPGLATFWLRPLRVCLTALARWFRADGPEARVQHLAEQRRLCREHVEHGEPVLIFMRSRAAGLGLQLRAPEALERARGGTEFLREIIIGQWAEPQNVSFVPLAILRGRGYRRRDSRFATLVYTVQQAPGEIRRVISFLWNRRDTSVVIGRDVQLREVVERHRAEGADRIVKRLSRALQIFLYREERMVQGPTLRPRAEVRELVVSDPSVRRFIQDSAKDGKAAAKLQRRARKYVDEMAANYHALYISAFEVLLNWVWRRMFRNLDIVGIERIVERVKHGPIVLVPCHRSHFDYLLLSYLFHQNYLSPPHIAAGENLAFWPIGPILRGAGGFFIRRSFGDDELYKLIFRSYLNFLIREGYNQEFFIEGSRSRTGKLLPPKLGMLSAIVDSFLRGVRRDLHFVPVSIQYSRVVEEQSYQRELEGSVKEKETFGALLRAARKLLDQRYGDVQVTFAEPISLAEVLGGRREQFRQLVASDAPPDSPLENERRAFVDDFAHRLLQEINGASPVTDIAIAATVLLGARAKAVRFTAYLERTRLLVEMLEAREIAVFQPLGKAPDFAATRRFLESTGLVERLPEAPDVMYVPKNRRLSLDFYKNNGIHWFLVPSLALQGLSQGRSEAELGQFCREWLEVYRLEFPGVEPARLDADIVACVAYFRAQGVVRLDGSLDTRHGLYRALAGALDNFHEPYWIVTRVLRRMEPQGASEKTIRDRISKRYKAAFLLGEVRKPEGNSVATIANAVERFIQEGCLTVTGRIQRRRGRGDRLLEPGPAFDSLRRYEEKLSRALQPGGSR